MWSRLAAQGWNQIFAVAGGNKLNVELILPRVNGGSVSVFTVNLA